MRVAAPPDAVWAYRLDFANLPRYNPDVSGVVRTADGEGMDGLGPGARYRFTLATPHGPHPVELQVTAAEAGTEVSARMEGAVVATETFVAAPDGAGGTAATLTLYLEAPDGIPDDLRASMLANGRDQIRRELDAMATNLGRPA